MAREYRYGRSWCPQHRAMADEVDHFTEENLTPGGRETFTVTELACGHYLEGGRVVTGPAPGEPYQDTFPVAASHRPADLARAMVTDPWADQ